MTPPRDRCQARTRKGERCRNPAGPDGRCAVHRRQPEAAAVHTPEPDPDLLAPFLKWAEEALEFLGRRLLGEYEVDEFGHDPDLVEHVLAPLLRPLYRRWWRVETRGLEHVPASGPALVVGNHAGTLPFDALMVALALLDEHPAHRSLRMLAADLAFDMPVVAPLARKSGNTLACSEDATRLLEAGELVGRTVDFSPEQVRFLQYGRVADTSAAAEELGFIPKWTSLHAFEDFAATRLRKLVTEEQVLRLEHEALDLLRRAVSWVGR